MPDACGHEEELKILRTIARLAGEWGTAFAELQISPTAERRKRAAALARQMRDALQAYRQFQDEPN